LKFKEPKTYLIQIKIRNVANNHQYDSMLVVNRLHTRATLHLINNNLKGNFVIHIASAINLCLSLMRRCKYDTH